MEDFVLAPQLPAAAKVALAGAGDAAARRVRKTYDPPPVKLSALRSKHRHSKLSAAKLFGITSLQYGQLEAGKLGPVEPHTWNDVAAIIDGVKAPVKATILAEPVQVPGPGPEPEVPDYTGTSAGTEPHAQRGAAKVPDYTGSSARSTPSDDRFSKSITFEAPPELVVFLTQASLPAEMLPSTVIRLLTSLKDGTTTASGSQSSATSSHQDTAPDAEVVADDEVVMDSNDILDDDVMDTDDAPVSPPTKKKSKKAAEPAAGGALDVDVDFDDF